MSTMNQLGKYQPYPEYKDSGVDWLGEIPKNWSTCAVWMRFYLGRGRVISNEEIQDNLGVYPVYSSQTLNEGVMGYIDTYDFNGDYITWTTDGANAGTVFTRAGKFNCTNVCGTLSASDPLKTNLRFYTYALSVASSWFVRHDINPKLMNNVMAGIRIPSLSPNEQRTIAAFLDYETARIDQLIAKQQQLIELLKEKRQAVISHAVTKGLNPHAPMKDSGVEWLGQVPEHWVVGRYKFCCSRVIVGIAEAATHAYVDQGIPLVRSTNIKETGLDCGDMLYLEPKFAAQNITKKLKVHDVITVRTGYPGISAVIPEVLDGSQCFTNLCNDPAVPAQLSGLGIGLRRGFHL